VSPHAIEAISMTVAVTALLTSCGAAYWAGRVDARLNNGISQSVRDTREDVARIFGRLDQLGCTRQDERLKHCEEYIRRHTEH